MEVFGGENQRSVDLRPLSQSMPNNNTMQQTN